MMIKFGRDGREIGDYAEEKVPVLIESHVLRATDLYWHEGLPEWKVVSSRWPVPSELDGSAAEESQAVGSTRRIGLILLGCGAAMGWLCVRDPLHEAANGAESVATSFKGVGLVPVFVVIGALYAVAPRWSIRVLGTPQERKKTIWWIAGPLMILGAVLYWLLRLKLQSYGYRF